MNLSRQIVMGLLLASLSISCSHIPKDETLPLGPNVPASMVIYFRTEVTEDQVKNFTGSVLSKADSQGRGHYNREGIRDILRVFTPVEGHEALAVTFFPEATQSQREEIKRDATSSPVVYKVLENVAPADVKKLD
jgi:hypothetical protein